MHGGDRPCIVGHWRVQLLPPAFNSPTGLAVDCFVSDINLGNVCGTGTTIGLITGGSVDCVDKVVAVAASHGVTSDFSEYRVVAILATERIVSLSALQPVIAGTAGDPVVVGLAVQTVPSVAACHLVLAGASACEAAPATGVQVVVALAARQGIWLLTAVQPVLTTKPDHAIYSGTTKRKIGI
jgi:hypothetical protein